MEKNALNAIANTLAELDVRWVLIGALAANRYRASPRLTQDIDALIADENLDRRRLEDGLRAAGWDVAKADAEGDLLRLRHASFGRVDLIVAGTDYQREAIRRARLERIEGGSDILVLQVEDVIVHKLIAGRSQDIADVEAILATKQPIDRAYVERWSEFWEVGGRWRAVTAAG